ncbi:hypothetical protein BDZ94DRAFT_1154860 [Collybia nuda]|uniref:Cytoplasmic tRNA 2-thiolation protein 2 n=1 Tax=Collybia nuda TaxID=64659 RepID=A0A9P6CJ47_9AGAR|nr:hypothetical protein BDZ94DRAFT_1154860 [Collybia nuda]
MSCGNPQTEQDALMIRRKKFDQARTCVKCKTNSGSIVVRYAVYCKECFFPLVASKFRRSLEPTINPITDGPRRRGLKASGNLLLGLSGGLGSTVLLDLVNRTYFKEPSTENGIEKPRGGKDHPRNGSVWAKTAVCYVETCSAFSGVRDKTEEIRAVVDKYDRFDFIPLRIEDAFDNAWWENIGGPPTQQEFGVDVTNEDLFLSTFATGETDSPVSCLKNYIASLPTQTAVPSAVQTLTRLLLLHTAMMTASSHLLLGTSLTSLSISLISSISQGGGFVVREEAQEEWTPRMSVDSNTTERKAGTVRTVRPLRDIGMKECGIWAWWNGLHIVGRERFPGGRQSIGALTKDFIIGLERDYPSTVSTIARTCAKLAPKEGADSICLICERPAQYGIQDWKARISIRSFEDLSSASYRPSHFPERIIKTSPTTPNPPRSPSLTPLLCYACHTTLTSRSIRGTTTNSSMIRRQSVPLPVWVNSRFDIDEKSNGEIWARTQMKGDQMKASIAEFLLNG